MSFERMTDRARRVMALANQEALRFNHECMGPEHILMGLIKEGTGIAANALKNLGIDLCKVRLELEKLIKPGPEDVVTLGKLPMTPYAKGVIEYATEEARNLGHNYLGSEHLLLGLLRQESIAQTALNESGLEICANVRDHVKALLALKGDQRIPDTVSDFEEVGPKGGTKLPEQEAAHTLSSSSAGGLRVSTELIENLRQSSRCGVVDDFVLLKVLLSRMLVDGGLILQISPPKKNSSR